MIFKYKNSNNVTGTFELNEDGELVDYEFYVPDNVPLIPVDIDITNIHTIRLKVHGINRMKSDNGTTDNIVILDNIMSIEQPRTKYELVKSLLHDK